MKKLLKKQQLFGSVALICLLSRVTSAYQVVTEKSDNPLIALSGSKLQVLPVENLIILPENDDNKDTLADLFEKIKHVDMLAATRCTGVIKIYIKPSADLDFTTVETAVNQTHNLAGNYQILVVG